MSENDASFNSAFDKFNNLISKASEAASCDANCQKAKTLRELEEKLKQSKINLMTAPKQVEIAYKNMYEFKNGELAYNELHDARLEAEGKKIIGEFTNDFKTNMAKIKTSLETYEGIVKNYDNIYNYSAELKKETLLLEKKFKKTGEGITTNERKSYYEDQGIDQLNFFYRIFLYMYLLLILAFIICIFAVPSNTGKPAQIGILIFLIIYPFISTKIFLFIMQMYKKIVEMLPKNAYKTI